MTQHGSAQPAEPAQVLIGVVAGVLPGRAPDPKHTRRWAITSTELEDAGSDEARGQLLLERASEAIPYALLLMARPDVVNWVRLEWVWVA